MRKSQEIFLKINHEDGLSVNQDIFRPSKWPVKTFHYQRMGAEDFLIRKRTFCTSTYIFDNRNKYFLYVG